MSAVKNKERNFFTTFNLNLLKIKEIILYSIITIPLMNIKGLISSCGYTKLLVETETGMVAVYVFTLKLLSTL